MEKAARLSEKNAEAVRASWQRAGAGIASLGAGVAGLFAGYSLVDAFKGNVEFIDSLNDMQDATGASIEKLSGLVDLAERTGHSVDNATTLVVKLNQALGDTDPNSTASRAIAAIGLSAAELRRMDPVDAIQAVSRALATYADDGAKARLVQELFGKSARELAPLIKDLAEAGELNARITSEQAAEADKFNKELARLQTNTAALGRSITADLLPPLNKLLELRREKGVGGAIMDMLGFNDKFFATKDLATTFAGPLNKLKSEAAWLKEATEKDSNNADQEKRLARLRQLKEVEIPAAQRAFDAAYAKFQSVQTPDRNENYSNEGRSAPKPTVGELPDKTKKERPEKPEMMGPEIPEALKSALDRIKDSDIVKVQRLRDELTYLRNLQNVPGGDTDAVWSAISKTVAELEKLDPAAVAAADSQKRLKELLAATDSRQLEVARADMELLAQAFNAGKISAEEFSEAASKRLNLDGAKDAVSELDEFTKQAGRNIQDTLGQSTYAVLSGQWNNLADLWSQTILRMVAEAGAANLGKLLLGDFAKTGSIGGLLGDGLKFLGGFFADGGAFGPNGQIRAFAAGDVFSSPTMFGYGRNQMGVLGEAGPEAIMPLKRGPDGKLGIVSRGGSRAQPLQVTYAPQIAVDSRSDRAAVLSDVRREVANGNRELVKMLKGQGAIA
ncbi:hypothetical protein [Roseateles sp.]|uniref:phage tail tape measure protein n=1 Tax=Roseateles sp. TaxID=1971397 RepID=UPI002F40E593